MLVLDWSEQAKADLLAIVEFIAEDNPDAAEALGDEIEEKAIKLLQHPKLYKAGRVKGTRELVVRPNYVMVYAIKDESINILRVLHAAQQWP
ncbi:MAG: type II toxin-antitoxin system RelE/ParE family toxin [Methylophilaceae bacterium]